MHNMLDCIPYGIYIVNQKGDYTYVNSAYVQSLGLKKQDLLNMNVHDFLKRKEIDVCISDIVCQTGKRCCAIQDIYLKEDITTRHIKHLIVSTPTFNADGKVENIIAVCTQISELQQLFEEANRQEVFSTISRLDRPAGDASPIAESAAMRYLLKTVASVAQSDVSVLITGETGAGKEVIAQELHRNSRRSKKSLVVINCASLPESLLEAELFGYEQGAFTGATRGGKKGLIEEAHGGTLFLDEINSLPLPLQGKILRALETKTIRRVGATKDIKIDFRLLSATNEDLMKAVEARTFRADLYYRLSVVPVYIPPLRERKEDIAPLAAHFLAYYNDLYKKNKFLSEDTKQKMREYSWPGNVRELKNFIERCVVMSVDRCINVPGISNMTSQPLSYDDASDTMPPELLTQEPEPAFPYPPMSTDLTLTDYLEACEKEYVSRALHTGKSTYEAARLLGISQSAVMRKKKKYGI